MTKEAQMKVDLMKRIFWNRSVRESPLTVLCDQCDQSKPQIVTDTDGAVTGKPGSTFELYPTNVWTMDTEGNVVMLDHIDLEECSRVLNRNFIMLPCAFNHDCEQCPAHKAK